MEYISFEHNNIAAELVKQAYDTPPLAFVHSYGCQQNVNDGERIKGVLMDIGYGLCDKPEDADLILFNTCAVREHAEQRVFGNVGALKGLKEKKHDLIIGLCGCMANQKHVVEKLRQSYPYVDLVFGVDGIDTLPQLIAQKLQKHKRVLMEPAQRPVIVENIPIRRESEFRAWLPIMYGCDNFCTYCIVPYTRGRQKSRASGAILDDCRAALENGAREITLLGQNVNAFGRDKHGDGTSFARLLALVAELPGLERLRYVTPHPKDMGPEDVEAFAALPQLCPRLHLPLQSGSDVVLRRMHRRYDSAAYLDMVARLRAARPDLALSTDLIVGFPGESGTDFAATLEMVRACGFMSSFSFCYSDRPGARAALLPGKIPSAVARERLLRLQALQDDLGAHWLQARVGASTTLLLEGPSPREGDAAAPSWQGRDPYGALVHVPLSAGQDYSGKMARVRITEAKKHSLMAQVQGALW